MLKKSRPTTILPRKKFNCRRVYLSSGTSLGMNSGICYLTQGVSVVYIQVRTYVIQMKRLWLDLSKHKELREPGDITHYNSVKYGSMYRGRCVARTRVIHISRFPHSARNRAQKKNRKWRAPRSRQLSPLNQNLHFTLSSSLSSLPHLSSPSLAASKLSVQTQNLSFYTRRIATLFL